MSDIDPINERIVQERNRDHRLSNIALADRVGPSPSACLRRVPDLERGCVITGYRAVPDARKLGAGFDAYIGVGLGAQSKTSGREGRTCGSLRRGFF